MENDELLIGRFPATKRQVEIWDRHADEAHDLFKRLVWMGLDAHDAMVSLPHENENGVRVVGGAVNAMLNLREMYFSAAQALALPFGAREVNRWDEYFPYMVLRTRHHGNIAPWMQRLIDCNDGKIPEVWRHTDTRFPEGDPLPARYLTNTPLENRERVIEAARLSGMKVGFQDSPMPRNPCDPSTEHYVPPRGYGSVYTLEPAGVDHSPFWREFDRLEY